MNKENMNLAFSVIIFALLIRNLSLMKQVDNLEKGIKKGDQLFIPVDQIDYNIHNLSDPVKEDTITVYSKIEDVFLHDQQLFLALVLFFLLHMLYFSLISLLHKHFL